MMKEREKIQWSPDTANWGVSRSNHDYSSAWILWYIYSMLNKINEYFDIICKNIYWKLTDKELTHIMKKWWIFTNEYTVLLTYVSWSSCKHMRYMFIYHWNLKLFIQRQRLSLQPSILSVSCVCVCFLYFKTYINSLLL